MERPDDSVRRKNAYRRQKDHEDGDDRSAYRIHDIHRILDTVSGNTRQHDARDLLSAGLADRRRDLDITVLSVIIAAALASHTADDVLRDVCLALIQAVCILDHFQILVDHHNAPVVDRRHLRQVRIDHLRGGILKIIVSIQLIT